jgi:hypothetical protein
VESAQSVARGAVEAGVKGANFWGGRAKERVGERAFRGIVESAPVEVEWEEVLERAVRRNCLRDRWTRVLDQQWYTRS